MGTLIQTHTFCPCVEQIEAFLRIGNDSCQDTQGTVFFLRNAQSHLNVVKEGIVAGMADGRSAFCNNFSECGRGSGSDQFAGEACFCQGICGSLHGIHFQFCDLFHAFIIHTAVNLTGMGGNAAEFQVFHRSQCFCERNYVFYRHAETMKVHVNDDGAGNYNAGFFSSSVQDFSRSDCVQTDDDVGIFRHFQKPLNIYGVCCGVSVHDVLCTQIVNHFAFVDGAAQEAGCPCVHLHFR